MSQQDEIMHAYEVGLASQIRLQQQVIGHAYNPPPSPQEQRQQQYEEWLAGLREQYPKEQYTILTMKTLEGWKAQILPRPEYIRQLQEQQEPSETIEKPKGPKPFTWAWLGESLYKTRMALEAFDPTAAGRQLAEAATGRKMTPEQQKKHREIMGYVTGETLEQKYGIKTGFKAIEEFKYAGMSFLPLPRPTPEFSAIGLFIGQPEWAAEYGELIKEHPGYLIGDIAQLYILGKGIYKAGKWVKSKIKTPKTKYDYWIKQQSELGKKLPFESSEDWDRFFTQMQKPTPIGAFERGESAKPWRVLQKIFPTQKGGGLLIVEETYPELERYLLRLHKLKPFQYAPFLMETTKSIWPSVAVFSTIAVSRSVSSAIKMVQPTKPTLKLPSKTEVKLYPKVEERFFETLKLPSLVIPDIAQTIKSTQEIAQKQVVRQKQVTQQQQRQRQRIEIPHFPRLQETKSTKRFSFPTLRFPKPKKRKSKDLFGAWFKRKRHIKTPEQMIETYMNMKMPKELT